MLKYSKYLFVNILSRKSFWITLIVSLFVIVLMGAFKIMGNNEIHKASTGNLSTNDKFIPYLLSSLITTLVVIFVFKSGQKDGTDLLVASKPVTRGHMIFGKFAVTISIIIGVQLAVFLVTIAYIQFDHYSFAKEKVKYSYAISAGGLIIQFIFSAFIILLALFVTNVGLLTISIIGSATIPIISMIIMPLSKATPWSNPRLRTRIMGTYFVDNLEKEALTQKLENIYADPQNKEIFKNGNIEELKTLDEKFEINRQPSIGQVYIMPKINKQKYIKSAKQYFSEKWYDKAAPFDIWYHWSSFSDSIIDDRAGGVYNYFFRKKTINLDTKFSMNPGGNDIFSKIFLMTDHSTKNSYSSSISKINADYKKAIDSNQYVSIKKYPHINLMNVFKNENIPFTSRIEAIKQISKIGEAGLGISYRTYLVYKRLTKYFSSTDASGNTVAANSGIYVKPLSIFGETDDPSNLHPEKFFQRKHGTDASVAGEPNWLYVNGDQVSVWDKEEYIKIGTRIWVWLLIVFGLFSITIVVYYRKDFK